MSSAPTPSCADGRCPDPNPVGCRTGPHRAVWANLLVLALALAASAPGQAAQEPSGGTTILVIFDASHSMRHFLYDRRKIDIAKDALVEALRKVAPDTRLGLRLLAHRGSAQPCRETELALEPRKGGSEAVQQAVAELEPQGTETPLAYTLAQARRDLAAVAGKRRVLLLSDGVETCHEDPVAEAAALGQADVPLDIVGIGAQRRVQQYQDMTAANGLGSYVQARNGQQLRQTLAELFGPYGSDAVAQQIPFEQLPGQQAEEPPAEPTPARAQASSGSEPSNLQPPEPEPSPGADEEVVTVGVDLEIVFDVSNSMWGQIDGTAKIQTARRALAKALESLAGSGVMVGFRAYGHRVVWQDRARGCQDTELVEPFALDSGEAIRRTAAQLQPKGQTPIALSLDRAGEDLAARPGYRHFVLLVSDGIESCDGDPVAAARRLRERGIEVVIHTVGFAVDSAAQQQLQAIAEATGGTYSPAGEYEALAASLTAITRLVAETAASVEAERERNPVMGGDTLEQAVPLVPGRYTLREHLPAGKYTYFRFQARSGELVSIGAQVTAFIPTEHGEGIHASHVRVYLYDAEGERIRGARAVAIGQPGTRAQGRFVATEDTTLFLAVGADFNRLHRDSLFEVRISDVSDAGTGRDVAADGEVPLRVGTIQGSLGLQDHQDQYRIDGPLAAGTRWVFTTSPEVDPFRLQVELVDGSGKRIGRTFSRAGDNVLEVQLPRALERAYLRLTDRSVSSAGAFTRYRLTAQVR